MSNVDINVDRRTDGRTENRTPISHPATSRCDNKRKTVLQSYQYVTFPKHILQSKEPNTNSQVQVLLKLPRYTMFENRDKTGSVQKLNVVPFVQCEPDILIL